MVCDRGFPWPAHATPLNVLGLSERGIALHMVINRHENL